MTIFRSKFSEDIFNSKGYAKPGCETWGKLANQIVNEVCRKFLKHDEICELTNKTSEMKFLPGGRYLYYAGRPVKYYNNCFLIKAEEDTREDWADLSWKVESALMTGGGVGVDYSIYRPEGTPLRRTGGEASGPINAVQKINGIGRATRQGGSRRSALWGGLNWRHKDIYKWMKIKNWNEINIPGTDLSLAELKTRDFNFPAPLDCTNISVNYDTSWLYNYKTTGGVHEVFLENVKQALSTGEPGFGFNFYHQEQQTLRNAPLSGDTNVLTSEGYIPIKYIIDKPVTLWTGKQWVNDVEFKLTNNNAKILKISMSNGKFIKSDFNHEFFQAIELPKEYDFQRFNFKFIKTKAKDLKVKDYLIPIYGPACKEVLVQITDIKELNSEPVYCCDVKVDEHSFVAEGVVVSNCTELLSEDDSDVCNLGSINMSRIDTLEEFKQTVELAIKFLVCGTLTADLPYEKVYKVRNKNRRVGLGLMGIHEWLLKRGYKYEVTAELHTWLDFYRSYSIVAASEICSRLNVSYPKGLRAIAPNGSIGILAGTTTGIEPIFAVAYKRRYLDNNEWVYQYVVDGTAKYLIEQGMNPDDIETALDLAYDYERRIKFQADVQDYVDHAISSTINLPEWRSEYNNESKVEEFANVLARYAEKLRGFTCYPTGARGGQPLERVDYKEAYEKQGQIFTEKHHDVCELANKSTCEA